MKKCIQCGVAQALEEFHKNSAYKDGHQSRCRTCHNGMRNARLDHIKSTIDALKAVPCADCATEYPAVCMDFDHISDYKHFDIGNARAQGYALDRVLNEIAKCEVVCSNCHRLRTAARRGASL